MPLSDTDTCASCTHVRDEAIPCDELNQMEEIIRCRIRDLSLLLQKGDSKSVSKTGETAVGQRLRRK